ncbi:hypothetical protein CSB45_00320 [candidate division KSB3 bacterium]|uniref:Uncharacterized protein n=1 Tax=candidate division KSB3 bacterium TaxID=2044937 RepID=A0A2G6EEF2_9BACT|nr:MAG: hypothetical protein CSB45_00320 [candidate division KSB3 bacterium]
MSQSKRALTKNLGLQVLAAGLLMILTLYACTNSKSNPAQPAVIPTATPGPLHDVPENHPDKELTPSATEGSCDHFADDRDDPELPELPVDGTPLTVSMDCTGDVDWYVITLPTRPVRLTILLSGIDEGDDFDLNLHDAQFVELEGGRSTQAGSSDEELSLVVDGSLLYLQVYAFSGRGKARLEAHAAQTDSDDNSDKSGQDAHAGDQDAASEGSLIEQLSAEDLLKSTFWFYPRGNSYDLLERSTETRMVHSIDCTLSDSAISGDLTLVNFAHVERDLLESVDYIDGWALIVFNGSKSVLEELQLRIRVKISSDELDIEVVPPVEMTFDGSEYIVSKRGQGGYYVSQSYGDLASKSERDLRVSSGVIGDLGQTDSSAIFEQQVDVDWFIGENEGKSLSCSGHLSGKAITDFDLSTYLRSLHKQQIPPQ